MRDNTTTGRAPVLWFALPALLVGIAAAGIALGGAWAWAGIAQLPLLAAGDHLLGPDQRPRARCPGGLADGLLCLQLPLVAALWGVLAWRFGPGAAALAGPDWAGAVLSGAFATAYGALPASHELGHRPDRLRRALGNALDTFLLAPYGVLSHNHVHHLALGTADDAETARRGQSLYAFMPRMALRRHLESWRVEAARLRRLGHSPWSPRSAVWRGLAQYLLLLGIFGVLGGWRAVVLAPLVSVLALLMLTALSYAQHYGLTRVQGSTVRPHHAWNHLYPLSRGGMFEITAHSGHHLDADVPYPALVPMTDAPQMPSAWACLLLALVPPLWERTARARLAHWDRHHASAAERALAGAAAGRSDTATR